MWDSATPELTGQAPWEVVGAPPQVRSDGLTHLFDSFVISFLKGSDELDAKLTQAQGRECGGGHERLGRRAPRVAGAVLTRSFRRRDTQRCSVFPTRLLGARPTLCWGWVGLKARLWEASWPGCDSRRAQTRGHRRGLPQWSHADGRWLALSRTSLHVLRMTVCPG